MNLNEFVEQNGKSQNNAPEAVNWLRLGKDESVKIHIPRPDDEQSLLGVCQTIFVRGSKGNRTFRVTDETYDLLLEHDVVPVENGINGDYHRRPSTRAMVNILNLSDGKLMVWEMSKSTTTRLAALADDPDMPDIHECQLKITKRSTGPAAKDVEWDIQMLGSVELTPEQEEACQKLHDVEKLAQPHGRDYILKFLGMDGDDASDDAEESDNVLLSKIAF